MNPDPHPDRMGLTPSMTPNDKTNAQTFSTSLLQTPTLVYFWGCSINRNTLPSHHMDHRKLFRTHNTFGATVGTLDNEMALTSLFS